MSTTARPRHTDGQPAPGVPAGGAAPHRAATPDHRGACQHSGATPPGPADPVDELRHRIDRIDAALLDLWRERATLSREVGRTRLARGGTRLVLAREQQILARFRKELGDDGVSLALLLLRAGRGAL
ncbi:MAG TPA: chorismate mutase [Pilimelia sp.]|nr:chorismate mutase [Pilimelia sp.]